MSTGLAFFVPGDPKPQPRPRAFARQLGNGKAIARVYDAGTAEGWKSAIADELRKHWDGVQFPGAVSVTLEFWFARPKAHYGSKGLKPSAPSSHTQRPDLDNLAKAVLDCLTTLGVWTDDGSVIRLELVKGWTRDNKPGCAIEIAAVGVALATAADQLKLEPA